MDVAKEIEEIKFTASITDASARDYEATPWIRDFIVTAEKKVNGGGPVWTASRAHLWRREPFKIRGALHGCPKRTSGMRGRSCPFSHAVQHFQPICPYWRISVEASLRMSACRVRVSRQLHTLMCAREMRCSAPTV